MPGSLRRLPAIPIEGHQAFSQASPDHPMRIMTRRAAGLEGEPWDDRARAEVAAFFDGLADEWHTRTTAERSTIVADALGRGLPAIGDGSRGTVCLELGSGIGAYTSMLAAVWPTVLCTEVAIEMLRRAPADHGNRVLADGARLPLPAGSVGAVVLINCFLFPAEVARVLEPEGVVVWVNTSGGHTPIHLPPEDVAAALPGRWAGVQSEAGEGLWSVLRRTA
jgi:hypothetical protein